MGTIGKTGLGSCKAVDNCVEQYRYDNDYTSRFIEECLTVGEGVVIKQPTNPLAVFLKDCLSLPTGGITQCLDART